MFVDSNLCMLPDDCLDAIVRHKLDVLKVSCDGVSQEVYQKYRVGGNVNDVMKNIGRVRARKLFSNRIRTIGDVKTADVTMLVQILGKAVALDVKKQVGQDIEKAKVPEGKRKGQISLDDY